MKIAFLLFLMIAGRMLMLSAVAQEAPRSHHVEHKAQDKPASRRPVPRRGTDKNRTQKPGNSNHVKNHREQPAAGNPVSVHPLPANRAGNVAGGTQRGGPENSGLPVKPSGTSTDSARHRTPNPAMIGGAGNSAGKSTGEINGARMGRKP